MAGAGFSFDLIQGKLIGQGGKRATLETNKRVFLYFSAHWCPPCRGFTPQLVEFYRNHHTDKNFEIIFVSHDRDESAFDEYFGTMDYLAVDYNEGDLRQKLAEIFGVSGIPCLVLLNDKGEVAIANARGNVASDPDNFPWGH